MVISPNRHELIIVIETTGCCPQFAKVRKADMSRLYSLGDKACVKTRRTQAVEGIYRWWNRKREKRNKRGWYRESKYFTEECMCTRERQREQKEKINPQNLEFLIYGIFFTNTTVHK